MAKQINTHISSKFHGIINGFLEKKNIHIVKQDIDSGMIDINKKKFVAFFEIKRSFGIEKWNPYLADKANYESLYNLGILSGSKVFVLFYEKDKITTKGIKYFEMNGGFSFLDKGIYSLKALKTKLLKYLNVDINPKDIRESGLQGDKENIYYYMDMMSNFGHVFYSEKNGWWMIVSSGKNYKPLFIYKEMINIEKVSFTDECFFDLANDLSIPYFMFCYKTKDKVYFKNNIEYDYEILNIDEFLDIYKNFCLLDA